MSLAAIRTWAVACGIIGLEWAWPGRLWAWLGDDEGCDWLGSAGGRWLAGVAGPRYGRGLAMRVEMGWDLEVGGASLEVGVA